MEGTQGLQGFKIALLIDFDNVILGVEDPGFDIELVVNALRSRGSVVMGRAYGDWYRHNRHRRKLMEHGIELVETPVFGPVIKNSADIRIVLDGFEIAMLQHHIDAFCLVSGDSDFLPLIKKLQYLGKHVIVISGNKFTSDLVRRNCNEFVSYENLLAESLGATEDVSTLEGAFALLSRGISTLHERGMEVRSSTVKQMMLQLNPAFSERNFSCAQFKQFLDKAVRAGVVKLGGRDLVSGEFMVFLPTDFDEVGQDSKFQTPSAEPAAAKTEAPREPRSEGRSNGRDRNRRRPEREEREARPETVPSSAETPIEPAETIAPALLGTTLADDVPTGEIKPTTPTHLLSRGLRRGRLRFSGKAGRAEVAESTSTTPEAGESAVEAEATTTSEAVAADVLAPVADAQTSAPATLETPEAAFEAEAEKAPESETATQVEVAGAEIATDAETADAEAAPKKRATRRGGKAVKAKAAKTKAKFETPEAETPAEAAVEAVAVVAEAPAKPTGSAKPTAKPAKLAKPAPPAETPAETPTEAAAEEKAPSASAKRAAANRTRAVAKRTQAAAIRARAAADATPAAPAAPVEAVEATPAPMPEAAPNPIEVGLAAADNKPRRRSGRRYSGRKKEGDSGANSENAS